MNLACKLGEDLAERGEVLLRAEARAHLTGDAQRFEEEGFRISGIEVTAHRLLPPR